MLQVEFIVHVHFASPLSGLKLLQTCNGNTSRQLHKHGGQGCYRAGGSLLSVCSGWTRAGVAEDSGAQDAHSDRSRVSRWTLQAAATHEGAAVVVNRTRPGETLWRCQRPGLQQPAPSGSSLLSSKADDLAAADQQ